MAPSPLRIFALLLVTAPLVGCGSSTQLETLQTQMSEIQRQLLQLQRDASTKEEISGLSEQIGENALLRRETDSEIRAELQRLSEEVGHMQSRLDDTSLALSSITQTLAATDQEIRALRNQCGFGISGSPVSSSNLGGGPPEAPEQMYQGARSDFLRGNYDLAILGFRQYLETYPATELADNALYWIGESYYGQNEYRLAIQEFSNLQARYPNSEKIPIARLKIGYSHLELDDQSQGIVQLQSVINDFPRSDEAKLARQTLQSLGASDSSG